MSNLKTQLTSIIQSDGPITFENFMEFSQFGEGGYYSSGNPISQSGDFYTSPLAHPMFGSLIAIQLKQMWDLLNQIQPFTVVEIGAGNGGLAADVTEYAKILDPNFYTSLNYLAFDLFPKREQHYPILHISKLPKNINGCVISNELLDAMPVHRFQICDGKILEEFVRLNATILENTLGRPSTYQIVDRVKPFLNNLPEGYQGEVNTRLMKWAEQVNDILKLGWVLTIDYGADREQLYDPKRIGGTLRSYYKHTLGQNPFINIGKQDITTFVDFTALEDAMITNGFSYGGHKSQLKFLENLGARQIHKHSHSESITRGEARINEKGIQALLDPSGMGRFRVTIHSKQVNKKQLIGLSRNPNSFDCPEIPVMKSDRHINLLA